MLSSLMTGKTKVWDIGLCATRFDQCLVKAGYFFYFPISEAELEIANC